MSPAHPSWDDVPVDLYGLPALPPPQPVPRPQPAEAPVPPRAHPAWAHPARAVWLGLAGAAVVTAASAGVGAVAAATLLLLGGG